MKNIFASFIQKPLYVTIVSLIVAGSAGIAGYQYINSTSNQRYTTALNTTSTSTVTYTTSATSTTEHLTLGFVVGGKIASVSVSTGDSVRKGEVLAAIAPGSTVGALTQAKAAYEAAKAAYDKVVNGASTSTIDVAMTSIATADQNIVNLLQNAYTQSDGVIKTDVSDLYTDSTSLSPEFGPGFYDLTINSTVTLTPTDANVALDLNSEYKNINNLLATWKTANMTSSPVDISTSLQNLAAIKTYLLDVSAGVNAIAYAPKYQENMDKYKADIAAGESTIDGLVAGIQNAEQALQTAQTSVNAVTSAARPEDVAAAKAQVDNAFGALQLAQAASGNLLITAPTDGTITAVHINAGEIATPNTTAIEMDSSSSSQ